MHKPSHTINNLAAFGQSGHDRNSMNAILVRQRSEPLRMAGATPVLIYAERSPTSFAL